MRCVIYEKKITSFHYSALSLSLTLYKIYIVRNLKVEFANFLMAYLMSLSITLFRIKTAM